MATSSHNSNDKVRRKNKLNHRIIFFTLVTGLVFGSVVPNKAQAVKPNTFLVQDISRKNFSKYQNYMDDFPTRFPTPSIILNKTRENLSVSSLTENKSDKFITEVSPKSARKKSNKRFVSATNVKNSKFTGRFDPRNQLSIKSVRNHSRKVISGYIQDNTEESRCVSNNKENMSVHCMNKMKNGHRKLLIKKTKCNRQDLRHVRSISQSNLYLISKELISNNECITKKTMPKQLTKFKSTNIWSDAKRKERSLRFQTDCKIDSKNDGSSNPRLIKRNLMDDEADETEGAGEASKLNQIIILDDMISPTPKISAQRFNSSEVRVSIKVLVDEHTKEQPTPTSATTVMTAKSTFLSNRIWMRNENYALKTQIPLANMDKFFRSATLSRDDKMIAKESEQRTNPFLFYVNVFQDKTTLSAPQPQTTAAPPQIIVPQLMHHKIPLKMHQTKKPNTVEKQFRGLGLDENCAATIQVQPHYCKRGPVAAAHGESGVDLKILLLLTLGLIISFAVVMILGLLCWRYCCSRNPGNCGDADCRFA